MKQQRLDLPLGPRIRYTRKSTEDESKQIASHDQQMSVMDAKWGTTNTGIHFQDSYTGTTFERPGFQELLQFCETHKQDKRHEKGVIEVYDMSRFGRILSGGEEDPEAVLGMLRKLLRWGWEVRFTTFESTGNKTMDFFQNGLYAIMAGEVSKKLARDVRRGRHHFLTLDGGARWMGGYNPPFGTQRVDPETGKVLGRRERAIGRGGTLLIANPEEVALWEAAARMLVYEDANFQEIAKFLDRNGARKDWGAKWEHRSVQIALTNPALMGELHIDHVDPITEAVTTKVYKAAWGPLVDEDLFVKVRTKVGERRETRKIGTRDSFAKSLLAPICGACGVTWYATRYRSYEVVDGKKQAKYKVGYTHPVAEMRGNTEWAESIRAAGCKHWYVDATVVENSVRDLILQQRTSEDFAIHLMALIEERGDLEQSASKQRQAAERKLRQLQRDQAQTVANMTKAQGMGLDDTAFWTRLSELNQQIGEVQEAKAQAIDLERVANSAWDGVRDLIEETKNLASIWEHGTFEKRREIVNWWVRQLVLVVDQEPGKLRSSRKYLLAFLRTAPTEGFDRLIAGAEPAASSTVGVESTGTQAPGSNSRSAFVLRLPSFQQDLAVWEQFNRWTPADHPDMPKLLDGPITPAPVARRRRAV